jgi:hypothetical protein
MLTADVARRLLALLRIVERRTTPTTVAEDDALLDAWFGPHSRRPASVTEVHAWPARAGALVTYEYRSRAGSGPPGPGVQTSSTGTAPPNRDAERA